MFVGKFVFISVANEEFDEVLVCKIFFFRFVSEVMFVGSAYPDCCTLVDNLTLHCFIPFLPYFNAVFSLL